MKKNILKRALTLALAALLVLSLNKGLSRFCTNYA